MAVHVGNALKIAISHRNLRLQELSIKMGVPKRTLKHQFKKRDIGLLAIMEVLDQINMQIHEFIEITGYYRPGSAADPSAWSTLR